MACAVHSGHLTGDEERTLQAWLAAAPEHSRAYRELDGIWHDAGDLRLDGGTGRLLSPAGRTDAPPARSVARPALAAAVALLLTVAGLGLWRAGYGQVLLHDLATTVGERSTIALADGSTLWLDARSAADVETDAGGRRLILHAGRAFVRVARDPGRPFTVIAGGASITALGTAYAVERRHDGGVEVAVAEHAVSVRWLGREVRRLPTARQVTLDAAGRPGRVTLVAKPAIAAWRQGRLVAEGLTLGAVVERLADYSAAPIMVADDVAGLPVNAVLHLDDVDAALAALQAALPIRVRSFGPLLTVVDRAEDQK